MNALSEDLPDNLEVVVLCGGVGSEREVSLESGEAVARALTLAGLHVVKKDLTGDPEEIRQLQGQVAFLALHGEYGEDGQVQQLLEARGLPYTGSDPKASALAMDKDQAKYAFVAAGLSVAKWVVLDTAENAVEKVASAGMQYPVVVKPNSRGSSVGVAIVKEAVSLSAAVENALAVDSRVMVEGYIKGRELTIGVLDGRALPVLELVASNEFYDYEAKYLSDKTRYICPAPLEEPISELCRTLAQKAYRALGMRDMARIDFILSDGIPYVLEANSIPGFTSHSLLPKAAHTAGIDFPSLCRKLVTLAWNRRGLSIQQQIL